MTRSLFGAGTRSALLLLLLGGGGATPAFAQLVAEPTLTYVSLPATANLGDTITISAGAVAHASDNSDGNDWNSGTQQTILRIDTDYYPPGGAWTDLVDWMGSWVNPNSYSTTLTLNTPGHWTFRFQAMDGRPWYSGQPEYTVWVAPPPGPVITSSLHLNINQGASVNYSITATNSPTSFGASSLPPGISFNSGNGHLHGTYATGSSVSSTISASNAYGTDSRTLQWTATPAVITNTSSVSTTSLSLGSSLTLTRAGTANFGVAWVENTLWTPGGGGISLGSSGLGSVNYTPAAGAGTYHHQTRVVDNYYNYADRYVAFTVLNPPVPQWLTATATHVGSPSSLQARVTDSDANLTQVHFYVTGPGHNDTPIGSVAAPNGSDSTITHTWTPTTVGTYTVRVGAHDALNAYYAGAAISTTFLATDPSVPTNLAVTLAGSTLVSLSWSPAAPPAGLLRYEIFRDGAYVGQVAAGTTTYTDTTVSTGTAYSYSIKSVATNQTVSAASNAASATTARPLAVFTP